MTFWLDRQPRASETGARLAGGYSHVETAISHLAYAVSALEAVTLSPTDRARFEALVDKLNGAILR